MGTRCTFYICTICFEVSGTPSEHHSRQMIRCDAGQPGDEARRPLVDAEGHLKTHAPRWFLQAIGSLPARPYAQSLISNL
ncbi:MAG TPA: hypothetical protein VFL17_09280 [Anaerolineae bacterium]|nr:hypothetical protein [Anaerolineae bacterium]